MNLNEISRSTIGLCTECPVEYRNKLLKAALSLLHPSSQDFSKVIKRISSDFNTPPERTRELLGLYLAILRLFIESSEKEFNQKLLDLGFPSDFAQNLSLVTNRSKVFENISNIKTCDFYKLTSLKWRIDISLYNSAVIKKIPTSVMLSIQLKNGRKCTLSVDIRNFHKLRFNVALIIKELTALKSHHIFNK